MMARVWLLISVVLLVSCGPPKHPTPGGLPVTGERITLEQALWLDAADPAVRKCLADNDIPIVDSIDEIRVHPTCYFWPPGYSKPVTGYPVGDRIEVGVCLRAARHEIAESLTHNAAGATKLCEHAGPKPPACECEPKPTRKP